ncbi:eukaryotic translation initiation factor 3 subunit G-domain-containing protein [Blastocladiella britannica]|nr:eukaryotic translation initiation factor 3 subunit G-domain-containing protein [Blastocladiella britannica]
MPTVHPNKNGTYTHIYFKETADGERFQVKRTLRIGRDMEQSKKAIEARKAWPKFGAAQKHKAGADDETTRYDTDMKLKLCMNPMDLDAPETAAETAQRASKDTAMKCRLCNGPHWTRECPSKDIIQSLQEAAGTDGTSGSGGADGASGSGSAAPSGRYVPPSLRGEGGGASDRPGHTPFGGAGARRMDDSFPIRIANLPEEMTDNDLQELTRSFGHVVRSYLAKLDDGTCKGFAFVNFSTFESAEAAVKRLNGYGYANLIMTCEHSKPREKKP